MIVNNTTTGFVIIILCLLLIGISWGYYKLEKKFDKRNIWGINQYLDKKFIRKLLSNILTHKKTNVLQVMLDEIIDYFCLDFIAFRLAYHDRPLTYKSAAFNKVYTDNTTKHILRNAKTIEKDIGYRILEVDNHRQIIIFKHKKISMFVASEANYTLPEEDKNTLANEIIMILECCIKICGMNPKTVIT